MPRVTRDWLHQHSACARHAAAVCRTFGDDFEVDAAVVERARAAGINVRWAACHLLDADGQRAFVAFTLEQRQPALNALQAQAVDLADAAAVTVMIDEARRQWTETGDLRVRNASRALEQGLRDQALAAPSGDEAVEAGRAAQRAASWAGLDPDEVNAAQGEWLMKRLEIIRDA